jgi:restriction system protein
MPGPVVAGRRDILDELNARVILIDGLMLARLMVEHNIGAQDDETFVLKKIDEDFFEQS